MNRPWERCLRERGQSGGVRGHFGVNPGAIPGGYPGGGYHGGYPGGLTRDAIPGGYPGGDNPTGDRLAQDVFD